IHSITDIQQIEFAKWIYCVIKSFWSRKVQRCGPALIGYVAGFFLPVALVRRFPWSFRMKRNSTVVLSLIMFLTLTVNAQERRPLKLIKTTPLPGFIGDFDHFAIDLRGKRLFLTAEDHKTVEVFD